MGSSDNLADSYGLITRRRALASGMTPASLQHQLGRQGKWGRALRGVYALQRAPLTPEQRWAAALVYGGDRAILGGATACSLHGLRAAPRTSQVHLLLPHDLRRCSHAFVTVRRTRCMPDAWEADEWRAAPVARAVIDACRDLTSLDEVRALTAESVQRRLAALTQLTRELERGSTHGSALIRRVLEEVQDGIRSAAEGQAREIVLGCQVPAPVWNVDLFTDTGEWLCRPDAWFDAAGVVLELDSQAWHLSPASWRATQERHARMTSYGLLVVHVAPIRLHVDRAAFVTELERCHRIGLERGGAPHVTMTPPVGWIPR